MKKLLQLGLLLFLISFFREASFAQEFNKKNRYYSVGVTLNAMNYVGELDPGPSFVRPGIKLTRPNFGIEGLARLYPRVSLRGAISYGRIKGSDNKSSNYNDKNLFRRARNLSMRNDILEVKVDAVIDLIGHRGKYVRRVDFTPYGFIGLAYFHHNPKAQSPGAFGGKYVALNSLQTEGKSYSLNQIAIPFGLGVRYKLSKQLDLAFEIGWRYTFTDYLDDVSSYYVDKGDPETDLAAAMANRTLEGGIERDPQLFARLGAEERLQFDSNGKLIGIRGVSNPGDQRGDKNKDWYIVTGFHLTYIIPPRVVCPKFR
ncbi:MAG: DUF6089 family protein [Sporocytophaga sp.]|nr:DUF6089 family protein [Sporocytophaga sp.]